MNIQIRKAFREDCPRILTLVKELAAFEKHPDKVTVTLKHFEESGFGVHPVWWAYLATIQDDNKNEYIAGFALYFVRYSTWKGQLMFLEDILITEHLRGKGMGKLLFERLIEEAKEKQFSGIIWQVLDWNEKAISFYKKYNAKFNPEWVNASIEFPQ